MQIPGQFSGKPDGRPQTGHFRGLEGPPLACRKILRQLNGPVRHPHQPADFVSDGLPEAADLAVAAFVEPDAEPGVALGTAARLDPLP